MSKKIILIVLANVISFMSIGCEKNHKSIKLATYTYSSNNRIENLRPLAYNLEKILKRKVEIISYPNVTSFIDGIKSKKVDIGLINTLGYLSLDNSIMEPIAALKVRRNALDNYKSVLLTNNDSIKNINSLKGQVDSYSIMLVNEGSTSGNLMPRLFLSSLGIKTPESEFKKVLYGGDHTLTLNKLLIKEVDLCAIGSNEYFKRIAQDSITLQQTRVLWISEEIPLGPVLLNKKLSSKDKKNITELFLNLHKTNDYALKSLKKGWSEAKQTDRFHKITNDYYNNFRRVNGNNTDLSNILKKLQN